MPDPKIVSKDAWLEARRELLEQEKELTRRRDEVNEARRRLPMVEVTKEYVFDGPEGKAALLDMLEGRSQLLVHHFMFDPEWDEGCPTCSFMEDHMAHLEHLHARDTTLAAISRAPLAKLDAYEERMGWAFPWYSSFGSDFNYDFHATLDARVTPVEYNFAPLDEPLPGGAESIESFGISAFLRRDDRVFHTYSAFARAADVLMNTYTWLDFTALGRQEEWEQPPGRSDGAAMHWLHRHDEYGPAAIGA